MKTKRFLQLFVASTLLSFITSCDNSDSFEIEKNYEQLQAINKDEIKDQDV